MWRTLSRWWKRRKDQQKTISKRIGDICDLESFQKWRRNSLDEWKMLDETQPVSENCEVKLQNGDAVWPVKVRNGSVVDLLTMGSRRGPVW